MFLVPLLVHMKYKVKTILLHKSFTCLCCGSSLEKLDLMFVWICDVFFVELFNSHFTLRVSFCSCCALASVSYM